MIKLALLGLLSFSLIGSFIFSPQYLLSWRNRSQSFHNNNFFRTASPSASIKATPRASASATPRVTPVTSAKPTVKPSPSVIPTAVPVSGKQSWGAYVGWSPEEGTEFETKVGRPMNNRATFVHWGNENEFPAYLAPGLKKNNETLTIFWEAMDYNGPTTDQPRFSYDAILRGDWDSYITSFASQVKSYGGPVILIPFEEMNGDWYPWSVGNNGNTIAKEIAAYRYVHGFFSNVPNVKFAWDINCTSEPNTTANRMQLYYPGDEYVDVVGVNGFNMANPWKSFDQIFGAPLSVLKTYNKPIYIFSMASADGPQKAAWITDALKVQMPKHPEVKGWVWFNENKERDWRVWSDTNSLNAFKAALP